MSYAALLVGLGNPGAGDDGVGLRVVQDFRKSVAWPELEVWPGPDPTALLPWLVDGPPCVVVDAARDTLPPGSVRVLDCASAASHAGWPLSSHGLGLAQVLGLARQVRGSWPRVRVVAVVVEPPTEAWELSTKASAAVPRAVLAAWHCLAELR